MWVEITEADLVTKISGVELDTFRSAVLVDGQADPIQGIFDQITRQVRANVAACRRNVLGDGNTIPNELLDDALALIVMEIMSRPGGMSIDPKQTRKDRAAQAQRNLERAAECKLAIEAPATVSTEVIGQVAPSMGKKCLRFGRDREDGI